MITVVVGTNTGFTVVKPIRRRVQGDVEGVVRHEERNPVSESDCLLPPSDVGPEVFVEEDSFAEPGGAPLRGQAPVEEKSACGDNVGRIQQLPTQDGKFVLRGRLFVDPDDKQSGESFDFAQGRRMVFVSVL